jgi:hypothetical protein
MLGQLPLRRKLAGDPKLIYYLTGNNYKSYLAGDPKRKGWRPY